MKRMIFALAILLVFSSTAQAHMEGGPKEGQEGRMDHGMMMGGEQMPMMEHMKAHGMMMGEMMDMMKDIIQMQKRIVAGVKAAEKKELEKELSAMLEKMEKMTSGMKGMMSQGMMMQGMLGGTASAETKKEEQTSGSRKTLEKTEAGVTVKVALESADGTVKFKIALETHTVELDKYKFDEIVALRAGGKEYKGRLVSQEGSGHHRSAVVEFDKPGAKEFDVVVKDVAGVKERVFKF
jgi:hypothetical protein